MAVTAYLTATTLTLKIKKALPKQRLFVFAVPLYLATPSKRR